MENLPRGEPGTPDTVIQDSVRTEQIRLLYDQIPLAMAGTLAVLLVVTAVLWGVIPAPLLTGWALALGLIILIRSVSWWQFSRTPETRRDYPFWSRLSLTGSLLSGLVTGSAGVFTAMSGQQEELYFLLVVFTGLCANALSTNASRMSAVLGYVLPLMLPTGLWLLFQGGRIPLSLGLLILLFIAILIFTATRYNRTLTEALRLRFHNDGLYKEMLAANQNARDSAANLQQEMHQREEAERHLSAYTRRLQRANAALQREIAESEQNEQQLTQQALDILESEVRMRAVFQNAFDAILTFSEDGRIDSGNTAAQALFGYAEDELVGRHIDELLPERDEVFSTRQVLEQSGRRSDGSLFPLAYSVDEMHVGRQVQYVCVARDQTQAEQARQALISAKEAAESANTAKSEFLSNMSHELRTPLNAILGFTQLLQSDPTEPLSEGQRESMEQISSAGWHLLQLINDVLDLAKIEAGRMDVEAGEVILQDIVQECLSLVQPNAEAKNVRLINHTAGRAIGLRANHVRLKQVLLNLLSNAIKYNRDEGMVEIRAPEIRAGRCRLSIADTGTGMSEHEIAVIFAPFTRVAQNRAEIEGTGIGLSITRRLLAMMGGDIGVESQPGAGSLFWIEIPLSEPTASSECVEENTTEVRNDPHEPEGRHRILYVEDNPANLILVQSIVRQHRPGYELLSASDGEQGLEMALENKPDLIILDISLPGLNGYEVLQALRQSEDTRRIPTIALSANAMPQDMEQGLAAGFSGYLTKPIDVHKLLETLDGLLGEQQAST